MARLGGIDTQYFDASGDPLARGRLYCYETGTYTPKGTFYDSAYTVPNKWPIELDAIGVPPDVFFSGTARFVLTDSDDTVVRDMDPITDNEFQTGDTILYRLGDIDSQFFDQNGDILAYGKLYVYENGTSTPKDTYSNNALSSLNEWPVVFDSVGFLGDVFFEGKARLVLTDQHGVQQRELDDVDTFDISYIPGFVTECPEDIIARTDQVITVCVYVDGDPGDYTFQWYQDLSALVGETGACITKTITAADDGSSLWVTVSDGASTEQCAYALITIDDTPCVYTPPASTITAELIWREEDGGIGTSGIWGTVATDGAGRIIANPTGTKIIVSDDLGDTWTEYNNSLPDSNFDPGVDYLEPTGWQYFDGKWRAHLSEIDATAQDANAYAAYFYAGAWTFGEWNDDRGAPPTYQQVGLRNGRYCSGSMYWDANGVVVAGRWGSDTRYPGTNIGATYGGYLAVARYTSDTGDDEVPGTYLNVEDGDNCYKILPLSDGYFIARWDGARMVGDWVASNLSSFEPNGRDTWGTVPTDHAVGNGVDTVILPINTTTCHRWQRGMGLTLDTFDPELNVGAAGTIMAGYSPQHWLYASGVSNDLYTSYCEDPAAAVFTEGPMITLPATISATGVDNAFQNIFYAGDNVWIGYYVRDTDRMVDIYKFTYGTTEGNCD
jgi:hypothetical protein